MKHRTNICVALWLLPVLALAQQPRSHTVLVNTDGTFSPQRLFIQNGDTVVWRFSERTDCIIPVDSTGTGNWTQNWKPYRPEEPNEFTGPMPQAVSGIFTLGPDGRGFAIDSLGSSNPQCDPDSSAVQVGNQYLCNTGEPFATMD